MTDATALAEQYVKHWLCDDNDILWERGGQYKEEVAALVGLIEQAWRETWEEAAKHMAEKHDDYFYTAPNIEFDWEKFVAWCRQQAQEVGR